MPDITIIRSSDVESTPPPAHGKEAGWIKRIIYPPHVKTKGLILGVSEVNPGYAVHRWHRHVSDKAEGYEVVYPKDFEEIYYIVRGSGAMKWKTEDGNIDEELVSAGDAVFIPVEAAEHELFNSGSEKMLVVFCGYPTPKVTFTK